MNSKAVKGAQVFGLHMCRDYLTLFDLSQLSISWRLKRTLFPSLMKGISRFLIILSNVPLLIRRYSIISFFVIKSSSILSEDIIKKNFKKQRKNLTKGYYWLIMPI